LIFKIKNFFSKIEPEIVVKAPARINLINPLDAVEADSWMPSVAIEGQENPLSSFFYIKRKKNYSSIKFYNIKKIKNGDIKFTLKNEEKIIKKLDYIKKRLNGPNKLIYASIYRFYLTNSYFWKKFLNENFEIGILTTIPKQSGLGGSAAIIISIIYGFAQYFNLINNFSIITKNRDFIINKDIIAEMATKIEDEDLKITAGYGDRYVISRGGLAFCSYFGKLNHRKISEEPIAVYDQIDELYGINQLPIIICYSGVIHESGNVHKKLRELYLKKNKKIYKNYKRLERISWKSRFALMQHDWKLLGEYFKRNTKIMNQIMNDAGFEYGIGLANNILISIIERNEEVYAAKLTGAGGGGSVFALVNPQKIDKIKKYWKESLYKYIEDKTLFKKDFPNYPEEILEKLKKAQFFKININKSGVKKIIID
jgi:galactokinase/mevalonate kinase-like predicted kinase